MCSILTEDIVWVFLTSHAPRIDGTLGTNSFYYTQKMGHRSCRITTYRKLCCSELGLRRLSQWINSPLVRQHGRTRNVEATGDLTAWRRTTAHLTSVLQLVHILWLYSWLVPLFIRSPERFPSFTNGSQRRPRLKKRKWLTLKVSSIWCTVVIWCVIRRQRHIYVVAGRHGRRSWDGFHVGQCPWAVTPCALEGDKQRC